MAVNEAARAARYQWRADMLSFDPDDDRKVADAALYREAARLTQAVDAARPGFQAAMDEIELAYLDAMAAWVRGGRQGDKPTMQEATRSDSSVQIFRAARDALSSFVHGDEFRMAVGRARMDNWAEPSDGELVG